MKTPLALFTYNRPAHTRRALTALARCTRLQDVAITLYSDAPRRPDHAEAVAATRAVLRDFAGSHPATLVERERNLGLAGSIAGSVGELTAAFGRVIVVEDDLVVAPDFLAYMLGALDRYAETGEVMQVAGCLLTGEAPAAGNAPDALFMPVTTTWGWATWERAWRAFDPAATNPAPLDTDPAFRRRFTLDGAGERYVGMLRDRLAGRNDSWGIFWWFAVARAGGQVLYPRRSLVWNGGFDNSGVHCGGVEAFRPDIPEQLRSPRLADPIRFPQAVTTDEAAFAALRAHLSPPPPTRLAGLQRRLASWAGRIIRRG